MSENEQEPTDPTTDEDTFRDNTAAETSLPDSDYRQVAVADEDLPDDLRPGGDNPLAEATDDPDAERQDLGDPHIEGLQRDADDNPVPADTDASEDAHHSEDADADGGADEGVDRD
jgi:hypothetical protein